MTSSNKTNENYKSTQSPKMTSKIIHKKITIYGRVQGVAFRKFAHQMAKKCKIAGYVQNQTNGSVYVEAEGPKEQIEQFINWCHQGSPFSKVDRVETKDGTPCYYSIFEIL